MRREPADWTAKQPVPAVRIGAESKLLSASRLTREIFPGSLILGSTRVARRRPFTPLECSIGLGNRPDGTAEMRADRSATLGVLGVAVVLRDCCCDSAASTFIRSACLRCQLFRSHDVARNTNAAIEGPREERTADW